MTGAEGAVLTFEGVKSDAIFAYRPPFNLLALFFLLPLKMVLTDRWFHKLNVTFVRVLNAPILLLVSLYERRYLWKRSRNAPPRKQSWLKLWEHFGAHGDLQAVFDTEPPQSVLEDMEDVDDVLGADSMWDGGGYVDALRRRRGSRSVYSNDAASGRTGFTAGGGGLEGMRRRRSMVGGLRGELRLGSNDLIGDV